MITETNKDVWKWLKVCYHLGGGTFFLHESGHLSTFESFLIDPQDKIVTKIKITPKTHAHANTTRFKDTGI